MYQTEIELVHPIGVKASIHQRHLLDRSRVQAGREEAGASVRAASLALQQCTRDPGITATVRRAGGG